MTGIDQDIVFRFLMWACGVLGAGLIATIVWVALGVMSRLDRIQTSADDRFESVKEATENQFKTFGQKLHQVQELVVADLHKHEVRLVRLEEWRKANDRHSEET